MVFRLIMSQPFLLFVRRSAKLKLAMTEKPPLPSDEDIWDELFQSESSKKFLEEQVKKVEELLKQEQK